MAGLCCASLPPSILRHTRCLCLLHLHHAAFALAELAERAGVPRGVLNVLCGDAKAIGEAMLKSEEVGGWAGAVCGWWGWVGGLRLQHGSTLQHDTPISATLPNPPCRFARLGSLVARRWAGCWPR